MSTFFGTNGNDSLRGGGGSGVSGGHSGWCGAAPSGGVRMSTMVEQTTWRGSATVIIGWPFYYREVAIERLLGMIVCVPGRLAFFADDGQQCGGITDLIAGLGWRARTPAEFEAEGHDPRTVEERRIPGRAPPLRAAKSLSLLSESAP
jgi:hypothetical protein